MYGGQVSALSIMTREENKRTGILQLRLEIGTRSNAGYDCEWRRDWHGPVPVVAST
jgi:hypothetical protein